MTGATWRKENIPTHWANSY